MQQKTKGIVLRTIKYGDSALIVNVLTRDLGHITLYTSAPRSRKRTQGAALWAPLSLIEFDIDIRTTNKMPRPKDTRIYYNYSTLYTNPVKSAIALFIEEFLYNATKGENDNSNLFYYIEHSMQWLDTTNRSFANFHIVLMIKVAQFLGIYPNIEEHSALQYFDLISGCYTHGQPQHSHFLKPAEASLLPLIFRMNYSNMHRFRLTRQQRVRCIEVLAEYYRIHVPSFPELKSIEVLQELFD